LSLIYKAMRKGTIEMEIIMRIHLFSKALWHRIEVIRSIFG
jgi:hypothetical protein